MNTPKIAVFGFVMLFVFAALNLFLGGETVVGNALFPNATTRCDTLHHPDGTVEQFCGDRHAKRIP